VFLSHQPLTRALHFGVSSAFKEFQVDLSSTFVMSNLHEFIYSAIDGCFLQSVMLYFQALSVQTHCEFDVGREGEKEERGKKLGFRGA